MQVSRLFEIIYILLDKKHITANELAEHFEVSKRTIMRDLDVLIVSGVPINKTLGKGGGISIDEDFILDKTHLSEDEQNQIIFALQSLSATKNIDAQDTLSKLSTFFSKTNTDWIEIDFSRWGNALSDKDKFDSLKKAIIGGIAVSFEYASSYGETTIRKVYPLKFILKSNSWYIQAYCLSKNDYRTFKLNRIYNLNILDEKFDNKNFVAPPITNENIQSSNMIHLKLLFSSNMAYRIYDEFNPKDVIKNEDDSLLVEIDLPHDEWVYGFLLSFGNYVKVLEPDLVKDNLLKKVEEIKNYYIR